MISRRRFVKAGLAGAMVIGFNPLNRSWVTAASSGAVGLPHLDGVLLTDPASLAAAADDFGHIVHRQPIAVLRPGSVDDIVRMMRYARHHDLQVGARGQGHTTFGQAQVEAGIVIDMNALDAPPVISGDRVTARAATLWRTLLTATLARGLKPPALTGYLGLSVGGTLSVGGIGGSSYRAGAQVDNVLALDVVTGEGHVERCSESHNRRLFEAVLGGLGQCAVIVSATLRLEPVETHTRVFNLFYPDIHAMLADQRVIINDGRFDELVGFVVPSPAGGWAYFLEAAKYFSAPSDPSNAELLAGLGFIPGIEQTFDVPYFAYADRVTPLVEFLQATGQFSLPHAWLDLFVPGSQIDSFAGATLASYTPEDLGIGSDFPILIFPMKRGPFTRPLLRVPDEDEFFLFDILGRAPDTAAAAQMVQRNRTIFEQARELDSTHYVISAVELDRHDWRRHFRREWGGFVRAKRRFDPDGVLTHGVTIF